MTTFHSAPLAPKNKNTNIQHVNVCPSGQVGFALGLTSCPSLMLEVNRDFLLLSLHLKCFRTALTSSLSHILALFSFPESKLCPTEKACLVTKGYPKTNLQLPPQVDCPQSFLKSLVASFSLRGKGWGCHCFVQEAGSSSALLPAAIWVYPEECRLAEEETMSPVVWG